MNHLWLVVNKRLLRVETSNQMWRRKQFGVQFPIAFFFKIFDVAFNNSIGNNHILHTSHHRCNAVAFPNQVVGGRESL